jgi:hypothetical protein
MWQRCGKLLGRLERKWHMTEETVETKPPYLPWTTFQNITDELRGKGLPPQLDKSAIQGKSGGTQAQYLAALQFFDFIDGDNVPTERFKTYVANPEARPDLMRDFLAERYASVLALGKTATPAHLDAEIRSFGVAGDTARKAQAFFLNAAKFAGIELSPYYPKTRPQRSRRSTSGGSSRSTRRSTSQQKPAEQNGGDAPQGGDAKSRYIDLLLKKAEDDLDPELLDRIERVIGVASQAETTSSEGESEGEA